MCRGIRRTLSIVALLSLVLGIASCSAPGKGRKAEEGFKNAEPIIAALKSYHERRNRYPATLQELVPEYLAERAWRRSEAATLGDVFAYQQVGQSYELKFTYTGPGINNCIYQPEASKWECFGHY